MRIRRIGKFLIALALYAGRSSASVDPPYITPATPAAGDLISINIHHDKCDLIDDGITWPPPVTRARNEITILFTGVHEGDPEWCYYGTGTVTYPIGTFSSGTYSLHVERRYMGIGGDWIQETLGVIPFTVSGLPPQQPIEAPTLSVAGLAWLCVVLIATVLRTLRPNV